MKKLLLAGIFVSTNLLISAASQAAVSMPNIFGDAMVFQQDSAVPIWGKANAGEKITVKFGDQSLNATADSNGNWRVDLSAAKASDEPHTLDITGENQIQFKNILIGEVWFCSGQSNMEYQMDRQKGMKAPPAGTGDTAAEEAATANDPLIRIFKVEKKLDQKDVVTTGWSTAAGEPLGKFSAVGYFFAKKLRHELHVPIGMIESSWGGTRIEPWTPESAYRASDAFKKYTSTQPASTQPLLIEGEKAGRIYDRMVKPLIPYAIRGALWYQGESNVMFNETDIYTQKMKALVGSWRGAWGEGDFPFYYVQVAPFRYTKRKDQVKHTPQTLPEFWEAQTAALSIPNTAMVVITDLVDNVGDIHPSNKWDVAQRLALQALKNEYGQTKLVTRGPVMKTVEYTDGKATIGFENADGGLITKGSAAATCFEIADKDGEFSPAKAEIDGSTIILSNESVKNPARVRFAWNETAQPNLYNRAGLPAEPFRTK